MYNILQKVVDCMDEGVHVIDGHGTTIAYNKACALQDGTNQKDVIGHHILETFPSLTPTTSTLLTVLDTKQAVSSRIQTFCNVNGHTVTTVNSTYPLFQDDVLIGAVEISKGERTLPLLLEKIKNLENELEAIQQTRIESVSDVGWEHILTRNKAVERMKHQAAVFAKEDDSILLVGESGTGKELFARGIHQTSRDRGAPFVAQNCAAIPDTLLESLLFGTAKGSFTGAADRAGLLELANGGTLFLDEINSMPIHLQATLLRVMEEQRFRRIGDQRERKVNIRIVAAMNENPEIAIREKRLREDLYYRLGTFTIVIPPLRERREDILYLFYHFLKERKKEHLILSANVKNILLQHEWHGNIRELRNVVAFSSTICEGSVIEVVHLPPFLISEEQEIRLASSELKERLQHYEWTLIKEAMSEAKGNITIAAEKLAIPRQTLQYKLKKMNEFIHV